MFSPKLQNIIEYYEWHFLKSTKESPRTNKTHTHTHTHTHARAHTHTHTHTHTHSTHAHIQIHTITYAQRATEKEHKTTQTDHKEIIKLYKRKHRYYELYIR